jgi:hypothetical protein
MFEEKVDFERLKEFREKFVVLDGLPIDEIPPHRIALSLVSAGTDRHRDKRDQLDRTAALQVLQLGQKVGYFTKSVRRDLYRPVRS